jgi:hypothetical protein
MQKLEAKKRKPVYNDRLSVLDFRAKNRKSLKLSEKVPGERRFVEFQMPSPLSTTSEGVGSTKTSTSTPTDSSVDPVAEEPLQDDEADVMMDEADLQVDGADVHADGTDVKVDRADIKVDANFTTEDVQKAAQVLLDAIDGVSSDEDDESEVSSELEGDDAAEKLREEEDDLSTSLVEEDYSETQEEAEEDFEGPRLLPAPFDDESDDDWRPAYQPKAVSYLQPSC